MTYGNHNIKQCRMVEYLGCHLDFNPSGESIAMKVLKKVSAKRNFFTGKTNV